MSTRIGVALVAIAAAIIVAPPILNPDKTDMRLLIDHWPAYGVAAVLVVVAALLVRHTEETQ